MKKLLLVCLCIILLFSGCSEAKRYPTDDTFHFETDAQVSSFSQSKRRVIAESPDGYYFAFTLNGSRFLFFADKETLQVVPVCNKPNCLHYDEPDEEKRYLCNAYLTSMIGKPSFFWNNGKLYTLEYGTVSNELVVTDIALDGSSKKTLFSFMNEETDPNNVAFHRGYFYAMVNTYDENMNSVMRIWAYSLDHPEKKRVCLFELKAEKGVLMDLQAYGNHLYFSSLVDGVKKFHTIDLRTGECKIICDIAQVNDSAYHMTFFQDRLLFEISHEEPGKELYELKATLYTADLDGGNIQKWKDTDFCGFTSDGQYVYEWLDGPFIKMVDHPYIRIYDQQGDMVVNYNPLDGDICNFYDIFVTPGEHVLIYDSDKLYGFAKSEIPSGKISPRLLIDVSGYGE